MNAVIKNAEISRRILAQLADGMSVRAAFDEVLGAGRYEQMVSDLYDELRAKASA